MVFSSGFDGTDEERGFSNALSYGEGMSVACVARCEVHAYGGGQ